ncbi:MAG: formate--tetrahydrofolate ligase [Alphaproteobacteria bacterium GWF2_58_20]|nr:MAG: formate--tetrahydrofolate ligase [Alphaproteobacteria bacterium GWF2_58_20]
MAKKDLRHDGDIARAAKLQPIAAIAEKAGIPEEAVIPFGRSKAKLDEAFIAGLADKPQGHLVLVTAITPTAAGEGKTTTSIGLADAMRRLGKRASVCLREPSLGPCFGMKGGATGGGFAQVVPMEDINLHFTGDFHAVTSAHNLLAAMLDNHLHFGNALDIDPHSITWRRVVDMNDRALRDIVLGLGGRANGVPRQSGFDITASSEIMAILCLSTDMEDLKRRLGNVIVAHDRAGKPVHARDLSADGAMAALLKDAFLPNLVQTLEGTPAFIHGGPFANIAHGCNSVVATRAALGVSEWVVTEAGFGADLGAEKFFDIKCRKAGLSPDVAVLVATIRALKLHGGVEKTHLEEENVHAVEVGFANLQRHVENIGQFGVPVVVAINHFDADTQAELDLVRKMSAEIGVDAVICSHWAHGGAGAEGLAEAVFRKVEEDPANFHGLYPDDISLWEKARMVARSLYGAEDIIGDCKVQEKFAELERAGYGTFPVCMAKTQYSFSTDPTLKGAPVDHIVPVRDVRLAAGAEFVVVVCGDIMLMPGLPRKPAAETVSIGSDGHVSGL